MQQKVVDQDTIALAKRSFQESSGADEIKKFLGWEFVLCLLPACSRHERVVALCLSQW